MSETGLPEGYAIRISRKHNREYFLNLATNESSWTPPDGTDTTKLNKYLSDFENNGYKPVVKEGKVRASHILIKHTQSRRPKSWKSPDGVTTTRDEAIKQIRELRKQILNKEVDFAQVAKTVSDDSSHSLGGDLGWFGKGQMQPPFEEASFNLNVGELSDPVETDSGIHLVLRTG